MAHLKYHTNCSLIFRTLLYIGMEFPKDVEEEGSGRVLEKEFMIYLKPDFGKRGVIILRISIINVTNIFSVYLFLGTRHDRRRNRNLP